MSHLLQDTITGLCLGGIGAKDDSGSTNVLQVTAGEISSALEASPSLGSPFGMPNHDAETCLRHAETTQEHIETTVQGFLDDATIGIVILSQTVRGEG